MNIARLNQSKKLIYVFILLCLLALNSGLTPTVSAEETSFTTRVSVASDGTQGNNESYLPSISADGRYVAFQSLATNFTTAVGDNSLPDVYVHDTQTGQTELVSVNQRGEKGFGTSASISGNGQFVAFYSGSDLISPNPSDALFSMYIRDLQTDQTTRITIGLNGAKPNNSSTFPSLSYDGRFIAYQSSASNLVPNDTNGFEDIFLYDRQTAQTTRISVSATGQQADGSSLEPQISADGRYVVFYSAATNLVPDDNNFYSDVFVHDRVTGETRRVSVSTENAEGDADSYSASISADGRFVVFSSSARNLTPDDPDNSTDIFLRDTQTGTTSWVSTLFPEIPGRWDVSTSPEISADTRFIAYTSHLCFFYTNCNYTTHVYLYDRTTGTTALVSASDSGEEGNDDSGVFGLSVSSDGKFVAYESRATNLVQNDTNEVRDIFLHNRSGGVVPTFTPTDTPTPTASPTPTSTATQTPTATPTPVTGCTFTDPLYSKQWDMEAIDLVGALNQFPNCQVSAVNIAVIDTGVDIISKKGIITYHPELEGRISYTESAYRNNGVLDKDGHGTHVSGIIAATQNNTIGIAGIHPSATLSIFKFCSRIGSCFDSITLADMIRSAVDHGARVINLSLGSKTDIGGFIERAVQYAGDHNPPVIIVAAAPDTFNSGLIYPATYAFTHDNVIAVSSSTIDKKLATYSITGNYLTIAAPGGEGAGNNFKCLSSHNDCVYSLWLRGTVMELQGTSMAAPHVSGVVALMLSANPNLTACQIKTTLIRTATAFSAPANGFPGNGILNASKAVQTVKQGSAECVSVP